LRETTASEMVRKVIGLEFFLIKIVVEQV